MIEIPDFPELTFREGDHTYKLRGYTLPSVSKIMKPLSNAHYGNTDKEMLHRAATRGTSVHEAVENYLLFGIEDIKPELRGYFEGFKKWIESANPTPIKTECRVYHKLLNYAGTADLPCYIDGKATLVDFKTTATIAQMLTRVQLEAYRQAFLSHGIKFERKIIIQSRKDGSYKCEEYQTEDMESWKVFTELLDVYRYIQKYNK